MSRCKYILVPLAIVSCSWSQILPQLGEPAKPLLDLTFPRTLPPKQTVPQNRVYKSQLGESAKPILDLTFLRTLPVSQNTFFKPAERPLSRLAASRQPMTVRSLPAMSSCSVPLVEAQIPKGGQPMIRKAVPPVEQMAPMPRIRPPAPACDAVSP